MATPTVSASKLLNSIVRSVRACRCLVYYMCCVLHLNLELSEGGKEGFWMGLAYRLNVPHFVVVVVRDFI